MAIRDLVMASMMSLVLGGCSISFMGTPTNSAPGYDWGSKQMSSVDYVDNREKPLRRVPAAKDPSARPAAKPTAPQRDEPVRKPVRKPAPQRTKPTPTPDPGKPDAVDAKPGRLPIDPRPVDTKPGRMPIDPTPLDTKPGRMPVDRDPVDAEPGRRSIDLPSTRSQREPVGESKPRPVPMRPAR